MSNRTFFKEAVTGKMGLKDIFSDVLKKHTPEQTASVLLAGTPQTTPKQSEMLSGWQKPYLFARFFAVCALLVGLCALMSNWYYPLGYDIMLVVITLVVPVTLLLFTWEMNIPRDISMLEMLKLVAVGGMMSLIFTGLFNAFVGGLSYMADDASLSDAVWAFVVEEPAKLAVICIALRRKNHKYILDGVLIGMAVGVGFAVMESFCYMQSSMREGTVVSLLEAWSDGIEYSAEEAFYYGGYKDALDTAFLRMTGSIAGHGMYAALYGGGLMIAKGSHELRPRHLLHKAHLGYFALSCALHALNNSDMPWYLSNALNFRYSWQIVETAIALLFFLPLLRRGVNQIVGISAAQNGGRVTQAVNRTPSATPMANVAQSAAAFGLSGLAGQAAGERHPVCEGECVSIGRSPTCTISLPQAANVSAHHCEVRCSGGVPYLTDLGSTNGTYVGGRRITPNQPVLLHDKDEIWLGSRECALRVQLPW